MNVQTTNERGEWVPAIPLPLYMLLGFCRCSCGETRWGERRYREHYALAHLIEGKPTHKPPPSTASGVLDSFDVPPPVPSGPYRPGSVHEAVNRGLPPRGGYPSGPTPVRDLPKVPTGPAPGARVRRAADGVSLPTGEPTDVYGIPAEAPTMHFDAGGEDSVACGMAGFSTRDRLSVTCTDCLRVMMVSGGMEPTLPGTVMVWPRYAVLPEGWRWANGDLLRRAAHPALAEAIGNQFASPHDERVLMVRLPDFRDPRTGACTHIIRVDPRV